MRGRCPYAHCRGCERASGCSVTPTPVCTGPTPARLACPPCCGACSWLTRGLAQLLPLFRCCRALQGSDRPCAAWRGHPHTCPGGPTCPASLPSVLSVPEPPINGTRVLLAGCCCLCSTRCLRATQAPDLPTRRHTPGPHGPEHTPCPTLLWAAVRAPAATCWRTAASRLSPSGTFHSTTPASGLAADGLGWAGKHPLSGSLGPQTLLQAPGAGRGQVQSEESCLPEVDRAGQTWRRHGGCSPGPTARLSLCILGAGKIQGGPQGPEAAPSTPFLLVFRRSDALDTRGEVTPSRKLGLVSVPPQPQGLARTPGAPDPGDSAHRGLGRGLPPVPGKLGSPPPGLPPRPHLKPGLSASPRHCPGSSTPGPDPCLWQRRSCCVPGPTAAALGPPSMWPIRGVWGLQPASAEPPGLPGGIRILHREAGVLARRAGPQVPNSGPWAEDCVLSWPRRVWGCLRGGDTSGQIVPAPLCSALPWLALLASQGAPGHDGTVPQAQNVPLCCLSAGAGAGSTQGHALPSPSWGTCTHVVATAPWLHQLLVTPEAPQPLDHHGKFPPRPCAHSLGDWR
ncbi:uncharacterized protein LOC144329373 isoform X1 [Macaca mulatta]